MYTQEHKISIIILIRISDKHHGGEKLIGYRNMLVKCAGAIGNNSFLSCQIFLDSF